MSTKAELAAEVERLKTANGMILLEKDELANKSAERIRELESQDVTRETKVPKKSTRVWYRSTATGDSISSPIRRTARQTSLKPISMPAVGIRFLFPPVGR